MKNSFGKHEPLIDRYGFLHTFKINSLHFIDLYEAQEYQVMLETVHNEKIEITMWCWGTRFSEIVNWEETKKTRRLVYLTDDEIQWEPIPIEEFDY
jgi:hypothetical protein